LTSFLSAKIAAASASPSEDTALSGIEPLFAPLHKILCESLKALTGQEYDAGPIKTEPIAETDKQEILKSLDLKLVFEAAQGTACAIGGLSPALVEQTTQKALHISESANDKDYTPSKLDALLLRPIAMDIGKAMSAVMQLSNLNARCGVSFETLAFGKSELKDFGELTQIWLYVSPEAELSEAPPPASKSKAKGKTKAASAKKEAPLSYLQLCLPTDSLRKLTRLDSGKTMQETPVIDPSHPWTVHMRNSVKKAEVPIRAVVESCHMTIAECTRLEIGQVISLPGVSLSAVTLMVDEEMDIETQLPPIELARGSLGIFKKNRALKLTENIDANFCENTEWLTL